MLNNRRKITDMLFAFYILKNIMYDNQFERAHLGRVSRTNRILVERYYRLDFPYKQPIARLIRFINEYCDIFLNLFFWKKCCMEASLA